MAFTLAQILDFLASDVIDQGDANTRQNLQKQISKIASLEDATETDITFIANPLFESKLQTTGAGAVLVPASLQEKCPSHSVAIVVKSPYAAYAKLTALFEPTQAYHQTVNPNLSDGLIHPTAILGNNLQLGDNVRIGAYSQIGDNCVIGDGVKIDAQVNIQPNVVIGEGSLIAPHVYIGHDCVLGKHVSLHSHASIGNDGFGFAPRGSTDEAGWQKIHQLGRVILGDHVSVGSRHLYRSRRTE